MNVRDVPQWNRPRRIRWIGAVMGLAATVSAGSGVAIADSGDFATTINGATDYLIPAPSCNTLRTQVGIDAELILACSIGERPESLGPNESPCDIVSGGTNAGLAVGQCLSTAFPNAFLAVTPDTDVLETNTNIRATAAGSNLALGDRDQISVTSASGGGTVLGLVDIQAGSCPTEGCPSSCGAIPVVASQPACTELQARLGDSVTANPPDLSHALFFDLEQTGTDSLLKVAVCNGYSWSCRTPGTQLAGTSYRGQVPFSVVDTPICIRLTRSTRC